MDELGHTQERAWRMRDRTQGLEETGHKGWRRQDTRVDEIGHVGEGMKNEGQNTRVGGDRTQGWMS